MAEKPKGFEAFDDLARKLAKVPPTELPAITLRCPKCGLTKDKMKRDPSDPPTATIMETQCPKCVGSDFSFVEYFDAEGNLVFQK
jgi:hypothetical protein